ncbi:GntR family transcriptional regulator [Actinomadura algeriensis]|uniref:DNA-binding GntR family transcriptional regulator n=1 Tax=Actinomadura algeriensis TaxID=1679523 RepID=A0ABR9K548_9ACTN|nr:GntR family transcriptional regulator [Actinomadura algeriensis]MBE1537962.1 DNA-binding GntR family transcriptional regulator [Actinomadura algeriensis]
MQAETVYRRLRELIVAGEYAPGERLTEATVGAALAAGRTPIREALRRLESDGLVRGVGRGVVVRGYGTDELAHAYAVRAALETLTARLAADRWTAGLIAPAALAGLERDAELLERVTADGDLDRAIELNRRFHRGVAELAGNPVALETLDRLWDRIVVSTRASLVPPARPDAVADEHRRLLRAITDGDRAAAGRIADDHVRATGTALE